MNPDNLSSEGCVTLAGEVAGRGMRRCIVCGGRVENPSGETSTGEEINPGQSRPGRVALAKELAWLGLMERVSHRQERQK